MEALLQRRMQGARAFSRSANGKDTQQRRSCCCAAADGDAEKPQQQSKRTKMPDRGFFAQADTKGACKYPGCATSVSLYFDASRRVQTRCQTYARHCVTACRLYHSCAASIHPHTLCTALPLGSSGDGLSCGTCGRLLVCCAATVYSPLGGVDQGSIYKRGGRFSPEFLWNTNWQDQVGVLLLFNTHVPCCRPVCE